ncbi:MAG: HAD family hydrolase [Magnetospirillum sp.]|nr:HAD family hydrolase [Magnetospirillum sp.]
MHIQSLDEARATARTGPVAAFSFDVFDTVLLRRCTSPDGVFERAFALAPIPTQQRGMVEAFVQHRQLAEAKARKAGLAEHRSPEVTIGEIYQRFPTHVFGLGRDDRPRLAEAEYRAEQDLCFANPDMLELLRELRASGIRVGFLSDTYWDGRRLGELLRSRAPELEWDFLYASCDHRSGKAEKLFSRYLADLGIAAEAAAHLGDNDAADVLPARKLGIHAIRYPQAGPALAALFQREAKVFDLMCATNGASCRLDGGARTARRAIAARAPSDSAAFTFGVQVLGPVLAAFDGFVAERVARLEHAGAKVGVAFLARDGLAPLEVWRALRRRPAAYVEINRRIALIAGSVSLEPVVEFFRRVPRVNRAVATGFLKTETPRMRRYFRQLKDGGIEGARFAEALPGLLAEADLEPLAARLRRGLLAHLRGAVPGFDDCTDIVLVDLGYSGTVQKALRTVLAVEGLPQRLHGLYLLTADRSFSDLAEGDSAEGFLSDAAMVPHAKRAVLSNVAILEQVCSAPQGSVRDYGDDGSISREDDPRSPHQQDLCAAIRAGAVHYAQRLAALPQSGFPALPRGEEAAPWAGAILARALLLPTDDELVLLGGLKHDINLGSQALAPMADAGAAHAIAGAKPLPRRLRPARAAHVDGGQHGGAVAAARLPLRADGGRASARRRGRRPALRRGRGGAGGRSGRPRPDRHLPAQRLRRRPPAGSRAAHRRRPCPGRPHLGLAGAGRCPLRHPAAGRHHRRGHAGHPGGKHPRTRRPGHRPGHGPRRLRERRWRRTPAGPAAAPGAGGGRGDPDGGPLGRGPRADPDGRRNVRWLTCCCIPWPNSPPSSCR